ncbi:hypothetical protein ERO13_D05G118901v2 [Gossypium hirsutum]|nr:hypothetical protein ERO13_D05G118901v2 [Gossypium hirsutum]
MKLFTASKQKNSFKVSQLIKSLYLDYITEQAYFYKLLLCSSFLLTEENHTHLNLRLLCHTSQKDTINGIC